MVNKAFLEKAEQLRPELITGREEAHAQPVRLGKGGGICLDFGKHMVGYVTLRFHSEGSHPDAPAWLKLQFAERISELEEKVEEYRGWISSGWVQQEQIHLDVFPCEYRLSRRYAFRYLKIEVLDVSSRYDLVLEKAVCDTVTSADEHRLEPYRCQDPLLVRMDEIACRTLHDCMQDVFEDGPKRDRRLWIGDLRLQALVNYQTYRQNDLVKRCLYLFAGSTLENGRIAAGMFTEPEPEADDTAMFDYSLFFIPTLLDHYEETGDLPMLRELWPVCLRQIELSQAYFQDNGLVKDINELGWCFIDWNLQLNKQAGAQGVYLYCLNAAVKIAAILQDREQEARIKEDYEMKKAAALRYLYDPDSGLFVSGADRQLSWASQIWMILSGVRKDPGILERIAARTDAVRMTTPYMYHHYVQALMDLGHKEEALAVLRSYWGGMADAGADTFWELYDPENPEESPYGGTIVNSYCHAWSCAPAYFLRKYFC